MRHGKKCILLAQFNSADGYPPVLHQAGILAKHAEVTLLDTGSEDARMIEIPGVERLRVYWEKGTRIEKFSRLKARFEFARRLRTLAKQSPDAIIAFEPDAIALMMLIGLPRECLRIGHLHEHPSPGVYAAPVDRIALRYVRRHADDLDLLVVADENRGRLIQQRWHLKKTPLVVRNCPRRLNSLPRSRLLPWLAERGVKPNKVVYCQGVIAASKGLEDVVSTMREWPLGSYLVLVGHVTEAFRGKLERIADGLGVASRLIFVGHVPYDELFSYAVGANIGMSLYDIASEEGRFMDGASNKRFEYAALAIPQIITMTPGVEELFVSKGIALAVPWGDREALASAINRLLENPGLRQDMGQKARALHLSEYNYENEFAPVMEKIMTAQAGNFRNVPGERRKRT